MNTSYYDQLHELLHTNPKLDIFNLYFLGICTEYASETTSLEWLLNQLPLNFPRLFEVFMGNRHEIGFISRTLLRIIHNIPQEDRSPSTQDIFDCEISEIEEDLKRILKDFELVRLLYPRVTKFQWFYLGIFMAKNRSFELLALLKGVYIDLLVRNYKYDERGKVDFLASLLTEKYKPETLPPSSRATRAGKIQSISNKRADLKRDLRSLVSMRNELAQREQKEEQEIRCLRNELEVNLKNELLSQRAQKEEQEMRRLRNELVAKAQREQKEEQETRCMRNDFVVNMKNDELSQRKQREEQEMRRLKNELAAAKVQREQEIHEESSCSILPLTKKEIPPEEAISRGGRYQQESRKRLVLRPRENLENKDPTKEEQTRSKFSSVYPKESLGFMRRPLQNMDTNIGRMPKVEPLVKCPAPLTMERISPKLRIDPKEKINTETSEIESRITKNIEAKSLPKDVRLTIVPPRVFQECPICFELGTLSTGVSLNLCKHFFHKECLQEYFHMRINEKDFPMVCAMDGCGSQILESQIIEALDPTYKEKFYSFSLKHFVETHKNEIFHCPTPNCEYFAFQDKVKKSFYCRKCTKAFCVECQGEWHDGKTCEETKAEDENLKKFNEYVTAKGCQKCPSCQYYIEKNEGCDHMTCRCGKEFCYSCLSDMDQCYCRRDEY